jgi:hypothetical protein
VEQEDSAAVVVDLNRAVSNAAVAAAALASAVKAVMAARGQSQPGQQQQQQQHGAEVQEQVSMVDMAAAAMAPAADYQVVSSRAEGLQQAEMEPAAPAAAEAATVSRPLVVAVLPIMSVAEQASMFEVLEDTTATAAAPTAEEEEEAAHNVGEGQQHTMSLLQVAQQSPAGNLQTAVPAPPLPADALCSSMAAFVGAPAAGGASSRPGELVSRSSSPVRCRITAAAAVGAGASPFGCAARGAYAAVGSTSTEADSSRVMLGCVSVPLPPQDQPCAVALAAVMQADQAAVAAAAAATAAAPNDAFSAACVVAEESEQQCSERTTAAGAMSSVQLAALSLPEITSMAAAGCGQLAESPTAGFRVDAEPSQQQLMSIACRQPSMPEPWEIPEDGPTADLAAAQQQATDDEAASSAAAAAVPHTADASSSSETAAAGSQLQLQPICCASPAHDGLVDGSAVAAAAAAASVGRGVNVLSQSLDLGGASGNPMLVLQVLQKLQRLPEHLLLEIVQKLVQVRCGGSHCVLVCLNCIGCCCTAVHANSQAVAERHGASAAMLCAVLHCWVTSDEAAFVPDQVSFATCCHLAKSASC